MLGVSCLTFLTYPATLASESPGFRVHELVCNWCFAFRFFGGNAEIVDYEDYH